MTICRILVLQLIDPSRRFLAFAALCCPIFGTVGLLWRSIHTFLYPCGTVLLQRCMVGCCWRFFCCCFGWPYEDDSFVGAQALGNFEKESGKKMEKNTSWVRAQDLHQFKGKRPQLFEGDIEPSDLCQGAVGDCWLVAAFACASEFPDMIRHMFLTKEYNPRGLYKVRIYDPQLKKWVIVTVDDRIPCKKGTNRPRFMKPNGNELWAILLEKAYAKHSGSYAAIEGMLHVASSFNIASKTTKTIKAHSLNVVPCIRRLCPLGLALHDGRQRISNVYQPENWKDVEARRHDCASKSERQT